MDIYTTSFCLPRNLGPLSSPPGTLLDHPLSPASSFDRSTGPRSSLDDYASTRPTSTRPSRANTDTSSSGGGIILPPPSSSGRARVRTDSSSARRQALEQAASKVAASVGSSASGRQTADDVAGETMSKLCADAMARHHCHVLASRVGGLDGTSADAVQRRHPTIDTLTNAQFAFDARAFPTPPGSHVSYSSTTSVMSTTTPTLPLAPAVGVEIPRGRGWNVQISGAYQQVMAARGIILRDAPLKRKSVVKVPRSEVLDNKENVRTDMRRKLDEIASMTRAHLAIVGATSSTNVIGYGLETERQVEIVITGGYENVEQARVRLLVLLDELAGLHSEACEIDFKLHSIIAGKKRCIVQTIQEETATNIYFPTPLSNVIGSQQTKLAGQQNIIFITGEFFGVQRARDMLFQVSMHKSKCIISRDTAILPRKLDWMLQERLDELKQLMHDNGTFINFPAVGSQVSMITIFGDHKVNIERTIRGIMQLACQFYVASFWLLPNSFDVFMPPPTVNPTHVSPILKHISAITGAETVFKSNCFELHGTEAEVRQAVAMVLELDIVQPFQHSIQFRVELANEHREFISGKKNGKLNKIMKSANVKIKFETFNDYNFLIDIAGQDQVALAGLSLLQEELPAELSFHIPEGYHKRIIGVGGKNIQRIMKKYGVYVKFSNAEDHAQLGGYVDNEDNVVARTPAKNSMNLEHLKQAVMEMVHPKDKDFVVETVPIPRRYQRTLLGEKSIFIHDIEAKTNSIVRFPNKESASDIVTIFGPESQVHIAAQMLLVHIPHEAEFRIPHSTELATLTLSRDWMTMTQRVKRDLNVTLLPFVDRNGGNEETVLKFCLTRANMDFLTHARDVVEDFLLNRKINLYPHSLRPRSDSFADAFPHFHCKLLSAGSEIDLRSDFNKVRVDDLRLASSTPDIKALFNAPPGSGKGLTFHQPNVDNGGSYSATLLPQHSPTDYYSHWAAPRSVPPYSPSSAFSVQGHYSPSFATQTVQLAHEEAVLTKRASDHQLQEKIRRSTPRTFIPRAQSLDMGKLDGVIIHAPASATLPRPQHDETEDSAGVTRVLNNLGL